MHSVCFLYQQLVSRISSLFLVSAACFSHQQLVSVLFIVAQPQLIIFFLTFFECFLQILASWQDDSCIVIMV